MSILLLTGPSGTGKTTLANALCLRHKGTLISERTLCHELANEHGYERSRYWIAADGAEIVGQKLAQRTLDRLTAMYVGQLIIVDGAYQPDLTLALRLALPDQKIVVAYVDAPEAIRVQRVAQRMGVIGTATAADLEAARHEMLFLDQAKIAFAMEAMRASADIQLDGNQSRADLLAEAEQVLGLSDTNNQVI